MAYGVSCRLPSVVVMAIVVVATVVSTSRVPAVEAQTCCTNTTQQVVSYCRNVQTSTHFTATITCCILAQHQPAECWCDIRRAVGDDVLGPNCLQGTTC